MSERPAPRPIWALAYILQDWTKRGRPAVKKAYERATAIETAEYDGSEISETDRRMLQADIAEALRKMRAYVTALEQVSK